MTDPTRVRNQPSLTTSSGLVWLILGAVLAIVCAGMLLALVPLEPLTAWTGLVLVVALFITLVVARFTVPAGRRRLMAMACVFGSMALVTLICVVLISGAAWGSLAG